MFLVVLLALLRLSISCLCLFRVLMAHTQRLEVEVKIMKSKVKQLEDALASERASGSRDIFSSSPLSMPGAFGDVEEVAESTGSLSIGSDGTGKYHGRFAGSEVRYLTCYLLTPHWLIPRGRSPPVSVTSSLGKVLVSNRVRSTLNSTIHFSPMKTSTKTAYRNPFDLTYSACHQKLRSWQ